MFIYEINFHGARVCTRIGGLIFMLFVSSAKFLEGYCVEKGTII